MNAMPEEKKNSETPSRDQVVSRAARAQWACGLCFGLLFLMGLSGVASITLLYDNPMYRSGVQGFEGQVMGVVVAMKGAIRFIHAWGGYAGILLAGWAGLEVFSFSRLLKRTDNAGWRRSGRLLGVLGLAGAVLLIASLLLLIPSGVAAKGFLGVEPQTKDVPAPVGLQRPGSEDSNDGGMVEWHTRELNYLMALGAIVLVFAASGIRRIALEAKKEARAEDESKD